MELEDIKEEENRYRIVVMKEDEDYILRHLQELKGRFIYKYDKGYFTNIIYDTECSAYEIGKFIKAHFKIIVTFETYEKYFD